MTRLRKRLKHRKNERGFPSLADPGSQERCHGIADSGPSGMPSSGAHGRFSGVFGGAQEFKKGNFRTGTKRWMGERDTSAKAASLAIIRRFRSVGFGEREQSGEAGKAGRDSRESSERRRDLR